MGKESGKAMGVDEETEAFEAGTVGEVWGPQTREFHLSFDG